MLIITASLASRTFDEVNAEQSSDEYRENKFRHLCQSGSLCAASTHIFIIIIHIIIIIRIQYIYIHT